MTRYSIELTTRKYIDFCHLRVIYLTNTGKKTIGYCFKNMTSSKN